MKGLLTEHVRGYLVQDMQTLETALSALDIDFQKHAPVEANVFASFRKLIFAPSLDSVDFDDLANVIPIHVLLAYLVHQLPANIPTLPASAAGGAVTPEVYLAGTMMPLWEDNVSALSSFKGSIADLCDKYNMDPTESPMVAFIMRHNE